MITAKLKLALTQLDSILGQLDTIDINAVDKFTYSRDTAAFKQRIGDKITEFIAAANIYYTATK